MNILFFLIQIEYIAEMAPKVFIRGMAFKYVYITEILAPNVGPEDQRSRRKHVGPSEAYNSICGYCYMLSAPPNIFFSV